MGSVLPNSKIISQSSVQTNIFNDPRIISCDVEYSMDYNFGQKAIATIKMQIDPNNMQALNLTQTGSGAFATLFEEGDQLVIQCDNERKILGKITDPDTYKKIYLYYLDRLFSK